MNAIDVYTIYTYTDTDLIVNPSFSSVCVNLVVLFVLFVVELTTCVYVYSAVSS